MAERAGVPPAGWCGGGASAAAVAQLQGHDGRWEKTVVHAAAPPLLLAWPEGSVLQHPRQLVEPKRASLRAPPQYAGIRRERRGYDSHLAASSSPRELVL